MSFENEKTMEVRQEDCLSNYLGYHCPHQPLPSDDNSIVNNVVNNKTNGIDHHYLSDTRSQPRLRNMQRILNTNESSTHSLVDAVREKNFQSQYINQFASYQQSAFPHITEDENLPLVDIECNDINAWNTECKQLPIHAQLAQLSVSATGDDSPVDNNCSLDSFAYKKLDSSILRNDRYVNGQLDSSHANSCFISNISNSDTDWAYFVPPAKSMTSSNTNKKSSKEYSFFSDSSSNSSNGSLNGTSVNHIDRNNYAHESNVQSSNVFSYENFDTSQSQLDKQMEVINCISSMSKEQLEQMMKMIHDTVVRNQLCPLIFPTEANQTGMPKPVKNIRAHSSVWNEELSPRNSFLSSPNFQINHRMYFIKENEDILEFEARKHHTAAISGNVKPMCTWTGELPELSYKTPISNKVFVGGLPYHITENQIVSAFRSFGNLIVSWPGKEKGERFKGFVYVIFENESQVQYFLESCRVCGGNLFTTLSLRNGKAKQVQIIPWSIDDSCYPTVLSPSLKFNTSTTVFVGALHGTMNAEGLFKIMNDLFQGVSYAGLCVDKYKYPTGSGRVIFEDYNSYVKAISAGFVDVRTPKFKKTLQLDAFMEDVPCSVCNLYLGPYFCRERSCFRYFCSNCWKIYHKKWQLAHNSPLKKNSKFVLPGSFDSMTNRI